MEEEEVEDQSWCGCETTLSKPVPRLVQSSRQQSQRMMRSVLRLSETLTLSLTESRDG